jgi:hypothetical protein
VCAWAAAPSLAEVMRAGRIILIVLSIAVMATFAVLLFSGSPEQAQMSDYDAQRAAREQERQQLIDDCIAESSQGAGDVSARARCELAHPAPIRIR